MRPPFVVDGAVPPGTIIMVAPGPPIRVDLPRGASRDDVLRAAGEQLVREGRVVVLKDVRS